MFVYKVLASYIKPFGKQSDSHKAPFPEYSQSSSGGSYPLVLFLLELLGESCLIPALASYLRNDSGMYICIAEVRLVNHNKRLRVVFN